MLGKWILVEETSSSNHTAVQRAPFSCLEGKSIIQALFFISRLRIFEMYYKVMLRWGYFCLWNCLEMQVQYFSTYRATGVVQITVRWMIAVPHLEFDLAESISLMWQGFYFPPWQISAVWLVDDATSNDPANWTISRFHFFPNAAPPNVRIIHSGHACNIEEERYTERVYTIREGETLELTCLVSGHPRPQVRLSVFTDLCCFSIVSMIIAGLLVGEMGYLHKIRIWKFHSLCPKPNTSMRENSTPTV